MLKTLQSKKGFTLIELMIVVAIIGILAAIAIPQYIKYVKRSRTSEALSHAQSAYNALADWYVNPDLGNGTFLDAAFANVARTGGATFETHFPQEYAWLSSGDLGYTYAFDSATGAGGGIVPLVTGSARNADAVFGEIIISLAGGESTISRVSATY
ncbi:MAG TPA: prepilin-type N-terminal cleavage/methylation domain-containing protein [Nitrospiria bacterium]|nr:prepilin-type N-terminal cleavage/methylation domain-containing protein [Nitrospiria bacterium]